MLAPAGPSHPLSHLWPGPHNEGNNILATSRRFNLADIDEVEGWRRGRRLPMTDAELALNISADDSRLITMLANDHAIAQELHNAEAQIQPAAGETVPPNVTRLRKRSSIVSRSFFTTITALFAVTSQSLVRSSRKHEQDSDTQRQDEHPTGTHCAICLDPISGVKIRAACGHFYDQGCVANLFEASTRDESLFPPRCCRTEIPLSDVRPYLTPALAALFLDKAREFGTTKRVYCAHRSCSQFLGPQQDPSWRPSTIYHCPAPGCNTRTCGRCKRERARHALHKCPPAHMGAQQDNALRALLALGHDAGWARCPGCAHMVERSTGCNHMTCVCKTQFCYLCRRRWKKCACPKWGERQAAAPDAPAAVPVPVVVTPPTPPPPPVCPVAMQAPSAAARGLPRPLSLPTHRISYLATRPSTLYAASYSSSSLSSTRAKALPPLPRHHIRASTSTQAITPRVDPPNYAAAYAHMYSRREILVRAASEDLRVETDKRPV